MYSSEWVWAFVVVQTIRRSRPSEGPLRDAYEERVLLSAEGKPNASYEPAASTAVSQPRRARNGLFLMPGSRLR